MAAHNELGKWGELKAIEFLRKKGLYIRHTDWRYKHYDLDIVAIDEDMTMLIIVEVKTRSTEDFGEPELAVTLEKKNNILRATAAYIRHFRLSHLDIRYDTIAIVGTDDSNMQLRHSENAFSVSDSYYYHEQQRKKAYATRNRRNGCW